MMLPVISLPRNAVCEHWSPMGGMDAMHQECHGLLSMGFLGGTVRHLVLAQVAKKKLHLICCCFLNERQVSSALRALLPFLWKAGNCTRFGKEPTPTHSILAAKFRPFLSQAEQVWQLHIQGCRTVPRLCFTHSKANIPPSPSPTQTRLHNFCWNSFFFFHSPWGKIQSWNGKFQLQQILNVAKSQAHGNRTQ